MSCVLIHSPRNVCLPCSCLFQYPLAMESPLISSVPTSPTGTSSPFPSTMRASYPSTIWPVLPGLIAPGRFEMKMCRISVDPMPSRMSTPKRSRHLSYSGLGRGSPAEMHIRTRPMLVRFSFSARCSSAA